MDKEMVEQASTAALELAMSPAATPEQKDLALNVFSNAMQAEAQTEEEAVQQTGMLLDMATQVLEASLEDTTIDTPAIKGKVQTVQDPAQPLQVTASEDGGATLPGGLTDCPL